MIDLFVGARILHVIGVVLWIGGVAFVTTVLIPGIRKMNDPQEKARLFELLESRFAKQAKIVTLVTAVTGFYMLFRLDAWDRYLDPSFWWVHAMTLVWFAFTLVLFVLEPLFLHDWFGRAMRKDPEQALRRIQRLHWGLLIVSLTAIVGAVAGSRGFVWFG
jgi:uncharacterized membrane protein